ncbi:MAG: DUF6522 family protein [Polymorphobacter sp.]|uniref:DUF6522 family protein n=1 Tax=Polymorphobacter sp. TaxID=1909290 RepID=UPI003A859DF2
MSGDVVRDGEGFVVAAEVIGAALLVAAAEVPGLLREGRIKVGQEEGVGEDEGRWRLSFTLGQRRLRLVVDDDGAVLTRSVVDFGTIR